MAEIGTAKIRVEAVPDHALRREALDQALRLHTNRGVFSGDERDVVETAELFRQFLNGEIEFVEEEESEAQEAEEAEPELEDQTCECGREDCDTIFSPGDALVALLMKAAMRSVV